MSVSGMIDSRDRRYKDFVRSVNSDTASVEEMNTALVRFLDSLGTDNERVHFKMVTYDNFMLDTEIQQSRRRSGELDSIFGGKLNCDL